MSVKELRFNEGGLIWLRWIVEGDKFKVVEGDGFYGWAALHLDGNGNMVDWDRVTETAALQLGLVK